MSVYVDILVLVNMMIGYCLLRTVQSLCTMACKQWRIILAAFLAGCSALLLLLPPLHWAFALLCRVVCCVAIIAAMAVPLPLRSFCKAVVWYLALNMLLAGVVMGLCSATGTQQLQANNTAVYIRVSPLLLIALAGAVYIVLSLAQRMLHLTPKGKQLIPYTLTFAGNSLCGVACVDTGFSATDIYTDEPVILLDYTLVRSMLTSETELALVLYFTGHQVPGNGTPLHLLPMHTAAGATVLPAIGKGSVTLGSLKKKTFGNVTVAFAPRTLGEGSYNALIGPNLSELCMEKEKVSC